MTAVILLEILGAIFSLHLCLGSLMLEAASALQALVTETHVCETRLPSVGLGFCLPHMLAWCLLFQVISDH